MCYLIAKHIDQIGCVAIRTTHGPNLVALKRQLIEKIGYGKIGLVTISRPSAYGEYEPYSFVETEDEFIDAVLSMWRSPLG